ncbi:TIGR00730 family Rossman fold protein [Mycobacterium simiae]|uniref:Cytokinin riboside 5'-monophosphate phosphoribohydrolase n=1 Tax=Mycobacterium simiae TaxID=1784 RepID=A0A5B1BSV9_MYCSI|nr:TIGR00730 family Rossman fold protein [Mycobacterium simiae]KAA1250540.1 TIGR00730 family Rossman fold protein [Mycobacterium simiae]
MRPEVDKASGEWAVCVYCSAGPTHPELLELAAQLGQAIADCGWTLIWGGGNLSAMGAVAGAMHARGGRTVGVIPKLLIGRELSDAKAAEELIVTDTMRERKQVMEEHADAFIVLPGGLGTLDELLDAWTTGYLGMHRKPIVIVDPWGHYDKLWGWLNGLVDSGYVAAVAMERLIVVDKVSAALDWCAPA